MLADETPVQSDIVARAHLADLILAALLAATTATAVLCSLLVLQQASIWALALCLCTGLAFLLRARAFVGLSQRMALLVGGTLVTLADATRWAVGSGVGLLDTNALLKDGRPDTPATTGPAPASASAPGEKPATTAPPAGPS